MQRELAARFPHEAGDATMVCALQQLKMQKVCTHWVPQQLVEKYQKNCMAVVFNFLTEYKNGNDLLEQIITNNESWIHFYVPERKSSSMVWKEKRKKSRENSEMRDPPGRRC